MSSTSKAASAILGFRKLGDIDMNPASLLIMMKTAIAFHFACAHAMSALQAGQSGGLVHEERLESTIDIESTAVKLQLVIEEARYMASIPTNHDDLSQLADGDRTVTMLYKLLSGMKKV